MAKALGAWWGEDFHRTPGSGGLHWSAGHNVAGDITVPDHSGFPFVVECKNQEGGWTLESVMLDKHTIKDWYAQVVEDARRVNKVPMLIFTRNYADEFVMMPYNEDNYKSFQEAKQPVMRTSVEYEVEISNSTERFDVMITTVEGLTSFEPEFYNPSNLLDWDEVTRLSDDIEDVEEDINDTLNKLNDIK